MLPSDNESKSIYEAIRTLDGGICKTWKTHVRCHDDDIIINDIWPLVCPGGMHGNSIRSYGEIDILKFLRVLTYRLIVAKRLSASCGYGNIQCFVPGVLDNEQDNSVTPCSTRNQGLLRDNTLAQNEL